MWKKPRFCCTHRKLHAVQKHRIFSLLVTYWTPQCFAATYCKLCLSLNHANWLEHDSSDTKPRVQLTQDPNHTLMHTEDSVSFLCHINVSTGWEFVWYKDDSTIALSGNNLTISSVLLQNAGSYKCQTRRGTSPTFSSDPSPTKTLSVEGKLLLHLPKSCLWVTVLCHFRASEGSNPPVNWLVTGLLHGQPGAQLHCAWKPLQMELHVVITSAKMVRYTSVYTWADYLKLQTRRFKDGQPIDPAPSPDTNTYTVTPQDDPEQSVYSCQGTRNGRPKYSKISDQFKTKNLREYIWALEVLMLRLSLRPNLLKLCFLNLAVLKRRVLLSIAGCIVFGISAVCLGCIFLRVFRKPGWPLFSESYIANLSSVFFPDLFIPILFNVLSQSWRRVQAWRGRLVSQNGCIKGLRWYVVNTFQALWFCHHVITEIFLNWSLFHSAFSRW